MEKLPHNTILQIFSYLDIKDLLLARGVCRVWRRYAEHPLVWRQISICDSYLGSNLFEAVLRAAPFVNVMHLDLVHIEPLLTTLCAAKRLTFSLWDDRASDACHILRRQVELGTLRELHIHMHGSSQPFAPLMEEVQRTSNLVKLSLQNYRPPVGGQLPNAPVQSSLKELNLDSRILDRHLQYLLFSHGKTLEVVSLPNCNPAPTTLLTRLEELRRLDCPPQGDMPLLIKCSKLASLTVRMEPRLHLKRKHVERARRAIHATAEFLAKATQLGEYRLFAEETLGPEEKAVRTLLLALGASGDSALQHMELSMLARDAEEPQRALAEALPKLPHLRRITLNCRPTVVLMTAMSPDNAPKLREIFVVLDDCVHSFLHQMPVQTLMHQNTSLHILARVTSPCDSLHCNFCRLNNCHEEVRTQRQNIGFFAHEVCDFKHDDMYLWVQL